MQSVSHNYYRIFNCLINTLYWFISWQLHKHISSHLFWPAIVILFIYHFYNPNKYCLTDTLNSPTIQFTCLTQNRILVLQFSLSLLHHLSFHHSPRNVCARKISTSRFHDPNETVGKCVATFSRLIFQVPCLFHYVNIESKQYFVCKQNNNMVFRVSRWTYVFDYNIIGIMHCWFLHVQNVRYRLNNFLITTDVQYASEIIWPLYINKTGVLRVAYCTNRSRRQDAEISLKDTISRNFCTSITAIIGNFHPFYFNQAVMSCSLVNVIFFSCAT